MGTRRRALGRRARQQAAVADLGRRALVGEPFDQLPPLAAETALDALDASFAAVLERAADTDRLRMRANVGGPRELRGTVRADTGPGTPIGRTLALGEPVVIADWRTESRFTAGALVREHRVLSSASVPIRGPDGDAYGVLAVYSTASDAFDADDVLFLRGVANVLGAATARRTAEDALRSREAEARLAMDVGRMGSWRWDPRSNAVWWSPELEGLYGLAPGSFAGDFASFLALVHPDDRARTAGVISGAVESGTELDFEHRALRPDGSIVWLQGRGRPLGDGPAGQWLGVGIDVTDAKAAAAERERLLQLEQTARANAQESNRRLVETVARLDALLENAPVAFGFYDLEFRCVRANEQLAAITGLPVASHLGRTVAETLPELWSAFEKPLRRVLTEGVAVVEHEVSAITPTQPGIERHWLVSFYPVAGSSGDLFGIGTIVVEITERRRAELATRIIAAASELIAAAPDLDSVLDRAARVALGEFADSCHVYLRPDARDRHRVGIAHVDAALERRLQEADRRHPLDIDHHPILTPMMERGRPLLLPSVSADMQEQIASSDEELELIRAHGVESAVLMPLVVRGTAIGLLLLNFTVVSGRRYVDADIALAAELGRRVAIAIDNAQLAVVAERNSAWLSLLARAGELLEVALEPSARLDALARLVLGSFADVCAVYLVENHGQARLASFAHEDPAREARMGPLSDWPLTTLGNDAPAAVAIRENRAVLVPEVGKRELAMLDLDEERRAAAEAVGVRSLLVVPLLGRHGSIGAIAFGFADSGRRYTADDIALATELARRSGRAVEHALLFEQEQTTAQTLQRTLLPERLPQIRDLELAARYLPGTEGLKIGGDWYDVVALPDGRVMLAIADVVGHGVRAAAAMGRLRHALQFCVFETANPAEIVTRLNRHFCAIDGSEMATLLVVVVEADFRRAIYCSAGHPPALLRRAGGDVMQLAGGRGMPLCATDRAEYEAAVLPIEDDDVLLLYTDGLIERRGESLDVGLDRLSARFSDDHADLELLVDELVDHLEVRRERDDDVALLAVRIDTAATGQLDLAMAADPAELARLRSALRDWMSAAGVASDAREELVVAVNEIAANAVEHAYGLGDKSFAVHARLDTDSIVVIVRDTGRWRPEREHEHRGRGLDLAAALVDQVEVHTDEEGTVVRLERAQRQATGNGG